MGALVDVCGWDRKKKKRERERERQGRKQEENREGMFTLFFFFSPQADVSLLWLCSKQTQLVVPTISKGLVAQAY